MDGDASRGFIDDDAFKATGTVDESAVWFRLGFFGPGPEIGQGWGGCGSDESGCEKEKINVKDEVETGRHGRSSVLVTINRRQGSYKHYVPPSVRGHDIQLVKYSAVLKLGVVCRRTGSGVCPVLARHTPNSLSQKVTQGEKVLMRIGATRSVADTRRWNHPIVEAPSSPIVSVPPYPQATSRV